MVRSIQEPVTPHEPTPARGHAVCANCVHVRDPIVGRGRPSPEFASVWTCAAAPVEVKRPAGTDPITGQHVPAWTIGTRCSSRNKTGECQDFTPRVDSDTPPQSDAEIADDLPVRVAVLALGFVLGAGLMAWLGGGQ